MEEEKEEKEVKEQKVGGSLDKEKQRGAEKKSRGKRGENNRK